jgi:hypothetical protein
MRYLAAFLIFGVAFVILLQFGPELVYLASLPVLMVVGVAKGLLEGFGVLP